MGEVSGKKNAVTPYFYITREALDEMHDLNVTYEHFMWDYPLYVISRRGYDFLTVAENNRYNKNPPACLDGRPVLS